MKKTVTLLTLFAIISFVFHKTIIFSFYETNQAYVVEKLCVNRNNLKSDCAGKCFLMQEESKQEAQATIIKILKEIKESVAESTTILQFFPGGTSSTYKVFYIKPTQSFPNKYWKPPTNTSLI